MKKKKESTIKELLQTSRGRSILFFGCYFFFFLFVILFFRTGIYKKSYHSYDSFEPGTTEISYDFSYIKSNNYEYTYQMTLDDKVSSYQGMKDSKRELFSYDGNHYYREFNDFYILKNGHYEKTSNPFLLEEFCQGKSIEKLVKKATYFSSTDYRDGKSELLYQITTDTILFELDQLKTDLDPPVNEIILFLDEDRYVIGVKYHLSGYANYINKKSVQIECNYSSFFDVSIESPL